MLIKVVAVVAAVICCNVPANAIPGGVEEMNTNGPPPGFGRAYKLAKMTLVPINYEKITRQVVAGVKYNVKFTAGPWNCFSQDGYNDAQECLEKKQLCEFSYVVQEWEPKSVSLSDENDNSEICKPIPSPTPKEYDPLLDPELVATPFNETEDQNIKTLFDQFIADYGRTYSPNSNDGMYWKRFSVFKNNLKIAEKLQKKERGSAKYGITKFMDYTRSEYKRFLAPGFTKPVYRPRHVDIPALKDIPKSYDWREHGAVTEVKNQGQCGSCWAFSTTGNVEGQWFLKKGKLVSLSEQELVDCDTVDQGCNGGLPSNAYKSIESLGGLETEKEYPYDGRGEKCQFKKSDTVAYVNSSVTLPTDEGKLAAWLYKNGPISIGINAFAMQFYFGGVSHPWKILCNPNSLDHGVLIVGYGVTTDGEPYWIIKNSWGENWGEEGYYRIYRGDGSCGVNKMATSAVVD